MWTIWKIIEILLFALQIVIIIEFLIKYWAARSKYKFFKVCLFIFSVFFLDVVSFRIFSFVWRNVIFEKETFRIWFWFYLDFLVFILTRLILFQQKKQEYQLTAGNKILLVLIFLITTCVYMFLQNDMDLRINESKGIFYTFIMSGIIIANLIIYYWLEYRIAINRKNMELQLLKLQIEQQRKTVIEIRDRYQEILKIRHDTKNYISNSLVLIEQGHIQEGIEYLRKFQNMKLGRYQKIVDTDSEVLNAVINSKFSYAYEKNISTVHFIQGKMKNIDEFDLSILLANLLDNALEACEKSKNKSEISLRIIERQGYFNINIANSIEQSVYGIDNKLKTKKKDKERHGYGMKSIFDIVKKHDGMIHIEEKEQRFIVDILLKKDMITS